MKEGRRGEETGGGAGEGEGERLEVGAMGRRTQRPAGTQRVEAAEVQILQMPLSWAVWVPCLDSRGSNGVAVNLPPCP